MKNVKFLSPTTQADANNEPDRVSGLIDRVNQSGGIAYAEKKMKEYQDKALEILNTFPKGEYQKSLEQLVIFSTQRKH